MDASAIKKIEGLEGVENYSTLDLGEGNSGIIHHEDTRIDDLERFQKQPNRIKADVKMPSIRALIQYINKFKGDSTCIFAASNRDGVEASLDYHSKDNPSWCDHNASVDLELCKDWQALLHLGKLELSQSRFVAELKDYAADVVGMTGARFLEILSEIKGVKTSELTQKTGNFSLEKAVKMSAGVKSAKGDLPEEFSFKVRIYEASEALYEQRCRLEVLCDGENVEFKLKLVRPHLTEEQAYNDILADIQKGTGVDVYGYTPEEE